MDKIKANNERLLRILKENSGTAYGQRYGFENIDSEKSYRDTVPLTEYSDYEGLDEAGRYTAYPIYGKITTSGSTGEKKLFPVTEEALKYYSSGCLDIAYGEFGGKEGPHLHTSIFRMGDRDKLLMSAVHFEAMKKAGKFDPGCYAGGETLLFSDSINDVPYLKTWLILATPDLVSIQSIFQYDMILVMRYLEENWRRVLGDMRLKKVGPDYPEDICKRLIELIPADSVLDEDERVLSEGFDTPIIPRLLKSVRFVIGIGGASEFETGTLSRYIGDIPVCYFAYGSAECYMGEAIRPGVPEYGFTEAAYFEFLRNGSEVVSMNQLWIGGVYEPVITTFSGLYRYRTHDLIRVVAFDEDDNPYFAVEGRERTLNIAGEKLGEAMIKKALDEWAGEADVALLDYSVGIKRDAPGYYLIFVETEDEEIPKDADAILDEILCGMSFDYDDVRALRMLGRAKVIFCGKGFIAGRLVGDGHIKHQIFLKDEQAEALLSAALETVGAKD